MIYYNYNNGIIMLPLLISMLIMLGMIGISAAALFNSTQSLATRVKSEEYVFEIKMVKKSVLALSTTITETHDEITTTYAALPVGTPNGDMNLLPAPIMKKKNVYNRDILYCPFGAKLSNTFTATVNGGPTVSYGIETRSLTKNNRTLDYVIGTAETNFSKIGVVGVIISPSYLAKEQLNCNALIYSNETQSFTIEGGRVETITALEIEAVNL